MFVTSTGARVQSRRGSDMTSAFPDIAAAAESMLPPGTVIDGELVIWTAGGPDFAALQRRLAHRRNATSIATSEPANLMAFDLLAAGGTDLRDLPFSTRRRRLEKLAEDLAPPIQLVPSTDDHAQAAAWLDDYTAAHVGIEGLVAKGLATPYQAGQRGWLKYKIRDTADVIVGAVIGALESPERLVLGRYDTDGRLRIVGSTHELRRPQRDELREHLFTAGPEHPWPPEISPGSFGHWGAGRDKIQLHRVDPTVVVEVSADRAFDRGRWRHLVRHLRVRTDLDANAITGPGG